MPKKDVPKEQMLLMARLLLMGEKFSHNGGMYVRSKTTNKQYYLSHYKAAKEWLKAERARRKLQRDAIEKNQEAFGEVDLQWQIPDGMSDESLKGLSAIANLDYSKWTQVKSPTENEFWETVRRGMERFKEEMRKPRREDYPQLIVSPERYKRMQEAVDRGEDPFACW